jgi:hypothetical protein
MKEGSIYSISEVATGRVVYIGQTRQAPAVRWEQHRLRDTPLSRHLREIGIAAFAFNVIERAPLDTLNEREIFWIEKMNTMHPAGLNHRPGGRAKGTSKRAREKLSASSKTMWADAEYREKMLEKRRDVWADPEYKAKMSAIRKAMWADPAFRHRMSERKKAEMGDPARRAKQAEKMRARWADPEYKAQVSAKISAGHKAISSTPEYRAAQSARTQKRRNASTM